MALISDYIEADPFNDNPLTADEMNLLVNREEVRKGISDLIHSASHGFPQNIAILGEDGIGKTSIINFVEAKMRLYDGLFFSRIDIAEGTEPGIMVKSLVGDLLNQLDLGLGSTVLHYLKLGKKISSDEIRKRLKGIELTKHKQLKESLLNIFSYSRAVTETKASPEDFYEILEMLREVLELMGHKPKAIIILLDEGQYVAGSHSIDLLQQMRLLFQKKPYMLVVGGSPDLFSRFAQVEPSFNNLFPEQNRLRLTPLEYQHVRELLEKRLELVRKRGRGIEPFETECIDRLLHLSGGNPRYVIRIASAALQQSRDQNSVTIREIEIASSLIVREMGRDRFDRLNDREREIILTLAMHGSLSITEIQKNSDTNYDLSTVSRKVRALTDRGYLLVKVRGNEKICHLRRAIYEYAKELV
ncbi:MAG: hypothetical protein K8R76_00145 [Candidatus Aegiribacteria sp.]|nr:hypothetical protein [Candidatus Aegiribacteria sp.]